MRGVDELKECHLCGVGYPANYQDGPRMDRIAISCVECGLTLEGDYFDTPEQLMDHWNKRNAEKADG